MRKGVLAVAVFLGALPGTLPASTLQIVPSTTLQAQTSNNTSAANSFQSQTNGNLGATNVSKVNMHSLLYPGNRTKIYAHFMPWFGDPRHMSVGYNSQDPAQIHRQIGDMISRGIDGMIIDWYGSRDSFTNTTTLRVMTEAEQHPGFKFAIMIDKGAIKLSACSGCTPQQTLIEQLHYVEQTFVPSPAYLRIDGRPVITNFDVELHYPSINWSAAAARTLCLLPTISLACFSESLTFQSGTRSRWRPAFPFLSVSTEHVNPYRLWKNCGFQKRQPEPIY